MKTIIRMLKYAKPYRVHLVVATVSLLLLSGIGLVTPIAVRELLNIIEGTERGNAVESKIWFIAAILLGLYLFRVLVLFLQDYFSHFAGHGAVRNVRRALYGHLQGLSPKYYADKQTGQVVSRVMEDGGRWESLIAHALPDIIYSIIMFAGVLTIVFIINPVLAALICIPIPLVLVVTIFARKLRKYFKESKKAVATAYGTLADNIQGMREIQVFNKQAHELEVITKQNEKINMYYNKGVFWRSIMNPLVWLLQGFGTIVIILVGGIMALRGTGVHGIGAADITAFIMYIGMLYAPVINLARIVEDLMEALTSGKRVFEIMDTKSDIQNRPDAKSVGILKGDVEFKDVHFQYFENQPILSDINFKIPAGNMVALVGPTGSGKSTITSLLARFYDIASDDKGAITIDGNDIRDLKLDSLRDQISIVLQDVYLFNGTIRENIAYGRQDEVPLDEVIAAAKTASIHEFIASLPAGYDTEIGERGIRLSGGQKQRIAIARAVLRPSPILILDEATSAIDNETETQIQAAINSIAGKRTLLVIAHRLSTVERADQILYLENGKIIERGTHVELLKKGGAYAKMRSAHA